MKKQNDHFTILNPRESSVARNGLLLTSHGLLNTPVFLPVGSQGSVKSVTPDELIQIGIKIVLANVYHLYLRPGIAIINKMGGLHKYIGWGKPILTDSGGYQVFSLSSLCKVTEQGVIFRSHIDGSEHLFSPESVMDMQVQLGSNIHMVLDVCSSLNAKRDQVREAMQCTHMWAKRCKRHLSEDKQLLFSIVQGGLFHDLRQESARILVDMDFSGYAIGGLSLGESKEQMWEMVDTMIEILPVDKPRYLMGVGSPEDIVEGISRGIDIFDSALPTRVARNGALYTKCGRINITKGIYRLKDLPIEDGCDCYTCRTFSTAYLHHLFRAQELLAYRLATIHNLRFITKLIESIRNSIENNSFSGFKKEFLSQYNCTDESIRIAQKKKWINAKEKTL